MEVEKNMTNPISTSYIFSLPAYMREASCVLRNVNIANFAREEPQGAKKKAPG